MIKPIFCSLQHETILKNYTDLTIEFVRDVASESRFNNYLEVYDIIVDYHNEYGKEVKSDSFYDWLVVLPINLSVMTRGFFAGIETKSNAAKIRSYRILLDEMLSKVIYKLSDLKIDNE